MQENAFENAVCEMTTIVSMGRWINPLMYHRGLLSYLASSSNDERPR